MCPFTVAITRVGIFFEKCWHIILATLESVYYLLLLKMWTGLVKTILHEGIRPIQIYSCLGR